MAKKSKVRKGASKRRGGTKKTTPKKKTTRKTAPKTLTQEHRQLAVYHNPFSRATKQPKIPDGKVTESLGFQTQAVKELVPVTGGDGMLHLLMFAGQNCGLMVNGDALL